MQWSMRCESTIIHPALQIVSVWGSRDEDSSCFSEIMGFAFSLFGGVKISQSSEFQFWLLLWRGHAPLMSCSHCRSLFSEIPPLKKVCNFHFWITLWFSFPMWLLVTKREGDSFIGQSALWVDHKVALQHSWVHVELLDSWPATFSQWCKLTKQSLLIYIALYSQST